MEKVLLIAGKDVADDDELATGIALQGRTTFATASTQLTASGKEYHAVYWNHTSALSARTVILHCVNTAKHLDEAVLVFDESQYVLRFAKTGASHIEAALDEMILGYHYLAQELAGRFCQRKDLGAEARFAKLVFLYKPNTPLVETVTNPSRAMQHTASGPLVAAASAAFKAFAENTAATLIGNEHVLPVLINCDPNNDLARRENMLANWLCEYLNSIDDQKKTPSQKQLVSWIKAGFKKTSFFF